MTEGKMSMEQVSKELRRLASDGMFGIMADAIDSHIASQPADDGRKGDPIEFVDRNGMKCYGYPPRDSQPKATTDAQPVAWFPTYANGEILRFFGDGVPVQASTTKENAEKVRLFDIGTSGNPVVPLYAYSAPLQAVTLSEVLNALEEFAEQGACLHGDDTHRLRAIVARMTSSQAVGDGWKRMTEEARRIQMRHFDKHEGDVYHAMQSLCVKFGSRREDTMIEDIPAITPQPVATAGDEVTE